MLCNCRLPLINNNVHVCSKGSVQGVGSKGHIWQFNAVMGLDWRAFMSVQTLIAQVSLLCLINVSINSI